MTLIIKDVFKLTIWYHYYYYNIYIFKSIVRRNWECKYFGHAFVVKSLGPIPT